MDADQLLQAYARGVEHGMRNTSTTSTTELQDYGRLHFSPLQFRGVFPANQTPEKSKRHRSFYIQNTSAEAGANAHWLAIACEPGEPDLLFDTFARPPTATWLPHLRHMETTDPDVNQQQHSRRCGQLCMAFGHVFLNHGRPVARMC